MWGGCAVAAMQAHLNMHHSVINSHSYSKRESDCSNPSILNNSVSSILGRNNLLALFCDENKYSKKVVSTKLCL